MSDHVSIREATVEDAGALRLYIMEIFAERLPTLLDHAGVPSVEEERAFIASCADPPNSVLLVAELDGTIVGMLDFHGHAHPQRRHSGSLGMSVSSRCRGRGIGASLLEHLFEWASSHAITRIELEVLGNNEGAMRLYERLGFEHEGVKRRAVRLGSEYLDLLQMARFVGDAG